MTATIIAERSPVDYLQVMAPSPSALGFQLASGCQRSLSVDMEVRMVHYCFGSIDELFVQVPRSYN